MTYDRKIVNNWVLDPGNIGLGDEILGLKNLIFSTARLEVPFNENTLIYEIIDPISENYDAEPQFDQKQLDNYYSTSLQLSDVSQENDGLKNKNKIYSKKIFTKLLLKQEFYATYIILNLCHPDWKKFEGVIIKNKTYNILNYDTYKKLNQTQILNDIKFLHKKFHNNKTFIDMGWIKRFYIEIDDSEIEETGFIPIDVDLNSVSLTHCKIFEKEKIENSVSLIEWNDLVDASFYELDFWKYKKSIGEIKTFGDYIKEFAAPGYYVYLNIIKYGFKLKSKNIYDNITSSDKKNIVVNFINYRTVSTDNLVSLQDVFKKILSSKFCIGTEGGFAHIALYAGIPFVFVIPDIVFDGDSGMLIHKLMLAIKSRYNFKNVFFTCESDLQENPNNLLDKCSQRMDMVKFDNSYDIDWGYRIISENKDLYAHVVRTYAEIK